jgi:hypothetical protein
MAKLHPAHVGLADSSAQKAVIRAPRGKVRPTRGGSSCSCGKAESARLGATRLRVRAHAQCDAGRHRPCEASVQRVAQGAIVALDMAAEPRAVDIPCAPMKARRRVARHHRPHRLDRLARLVEPALQGERRRKSQPVPRDVGIKRERAPPSRTSRRVSNGTRSRREATETCAGRAD